MLVSEGLKILDRGLHSYPPSSGVSYETWCDYNGCWLA